MLPTVTQCSLPEQVAGEVPAVLLPDMQLTRFSEADLAELVILQRCCWVQEALINDTLAIPALHESPAEVLAWTKLWTTVIVRRGPRLVAAVRGRREGEGGHDWQVGRLMVAPDLAGQGVGSWLIGVIEHLAPPQVNRFVLFTGQKSERNIATYQRAGYQLSALSDPPPSGHIAGAVFMTKMRTQNI